MKVNFRGKARASLSRANDELISQDDDRLKYAALELRMAIEAITYDRAQAYKAEIPPQEYQAWQPKKLMQLLLDIDSGADKGSAISIGLEEEYGVPAKNMNFLGTEKVFDFKTIKKYYDALGSYLHMPTLSQVEDQSHPDLSKLRKKCDEIYVALENALASPVFNITIGEFSEIICLRCEDKVRRRLPLSGESVGATCFSCGATYEVSGSSSNTPGVWNALYEKIDCPTESCDSKLELWKDQVKSGSRFSCNKCNEAFYIGFGVFKEEK